MSKKGYQKRLPTVLVPAPRAAPEEERVPEPPPEAQPEAPSFPHEEPLVPGGPPARPATGKIVAATALGLVVLLVVGVRLTSMLTGDDPSAPTGRAWAFASQPPVPIMTGESYVDLSVVANGDVQATHWIAVAEPLDRLRLELPDLAGTEEMAASVVTVLADGELVAGPDRVTRRGATYVLDSATEVQISYLLTDAVERSTSAPGRALAVVTSLDVRYAPRAERETRVVRASEVLMLACSRSTEEPPVPCGEPDGDGQWRVHLIGQRVDDRVVAQITLD